MSDLSDKSDPEKPLPRDLPEGDRPAYEITSDTDYDLKEPAPARLKPGDPGFVPPPVIVVPADADEDEKPVVLGKPKREPPPPPTAEEQDAIDHKAAGVVAYVFFLIPLVVAPHSKFARYHANQALVLLLSFITTLCFLGIVIWFSEINWLRTHVAIGIVSPFGLLDFFASALVIVSIVTYILLSISGIVNASNGEYKPVALVGHYKLIK